MERQLLNFLCEHPEFTLEQIDAIRLFAANYALMALMDTKIAKEVEKICSENSN